MIRLLLSFILFPLFLLVLFFFFIILAFLGGSKVRTSFSANRKRKKKNENDIKDISGQVTILEEKRNVD